METEITLYSVALPPDHSRQGQTDLKFGEACKDARSVGKETCEALYYHKQGGVCVKDRAMVFQKGARASFGTYINGFAANTWRKYARLGQVCLRLTVLGRFRLRLMRMDLQGVHVRRQVLLQKELSGADGTREYTFPAQKASGGVLYFQLQALDAGSSMEAAAYVTKLPSRMVRPVKLAAGICTYRREDFLKKNLQLLTDQLAQPDNMLFGHMEIFVADNGHTLKQMQRQFPSIHLFENPNLGGAAGFTRCMMEVWRICQRQKDAAFTHLLLMDDDVQLEWSSIEKTYALLRLLKPQYQDAFVAGAMLRADRLYLQEECGGIFGKYGNQPLQQGLDLRTARDCLKNAAAGYADYGAWWYCCFPVRLIRQFHFPLPLFIHGDDVEWGLRCKKPVIRMNGICVWHEPLEGKACASRVYYNLRNLLVCQALYGTRGAGARMAALLWKQFFHDVFLYQYQSCRAGLAGVTDFLKGPSFFMQTDAAKLHQHLSAMQRPLRKLSRLRMEMVREIPWEEVHAAASYCPGYLERALKTLLCNGCFFPGKRTRFVPDGHISFAAAWRSRRLVCINEKQQRYEVRVCDRRQFLQLFCQTACTAARLITGFDRAAKAYRFGVQDLQTWEFWENYLGIDQEQSGETAP